MRTAGQGPGGFEKRDGHMKPGQDLIMAGFAGLSGTVRIAERRSADLVRRFCPGFLEQLREPREFSAREWAARNEGSLITAYEFVEEGGVLAALWNLSGIFNAGIEFDLRRIPIRQITVEVCELYGLNPYRLLTADAFVAAADNGGRAVEQLLEMGAEAAVIGKVIPGTARQMRHGSEAAGYLERPRMDEYVRVFGAEQLE